MRSASRRPCWSKRQSSTPVAFAENRAKFTPFPSKVAPSGAGLPSSIRNMLFLVDENRRDGAQECTTFRARLSVPVSRERRFSVLDGAPKGLSAHASRQLGTQAIVLAIAARRGHALVVGRHEGPEERIAPAVDSVRFKPPHHGGPALLALVERHLERALDR